MVSKRHRSLPRWKGAGRESEELTEQTVDEDSSMKISKIRKKFRGRKGGEEERNKGGQRKGTMVDSFFAVGLSRRGRMRQKNRFLYGLNKQRERENERGREGRKEGGQR